jgi:hypothetical protein
MLRQVNLNIVSLFRVTGIGAVANKEFSLQHFLAYFLLSA